MPSLIPGYAYDIFISYRQKDNKYDGWVTEFVNNLRKDLEATFKEDISIYFDENPHDGLLETHDVGDSLKDKLRCLIFIPIISQTYCDPKSFAWRNEFIPFRKLASEDQFGLKIRLTNGNVASRVLPVRIHDLDHQDKTLLENELGPLRTIDFVFKSPGVNRPMRAYEDRPLENLDKTFYRDQINKTANGLKEIIIGMLEPMKITLPDGYSSPYPVINSSVQKSIVVLPFVNISNDTDQEFFSDGLTEEIISDLSCLHDLLVISRSSAMTFKGTSKRIMDIARELNVQYVLEGSVRKHANNLRITAQLIEANTDTPIWAEKYNETLENIFDIQERISRSIVDKLRIRLTSTEEDRITHRTFDNVQAYESYLHAKRELLKWNKEAIDSAHHQIQNALNIVGPNATLFATMAYVYWSYANLGHNPVENLRKTEENVKKALELYPESADSHLVTGLLFQTVRGNQQEAIKAFKRVLEIRPSDFDALVWLSVSYCLTGYPDKVRPLALKMLIIDPLSSVSLAMYGVVDFYNGKFNESIVHVAKAYELEPQNPFWQLLLPLAYAFSNRYDEAIDFVFKNLDKNSSELVTQTALMIVPAINKDKDQLVKWLNSDIRAVALKDAQYSHFIAALCSLAGLSNEAMDWLENAVDHGFANYPLLADYDPTLIDLRDTKRFQNLMIRVRRDWQSIEVL